MPCAGPCGRWKSATRRSPRKGSANIEYTTATSWQAVAEKRTPKDGEMRSRCPSSSCSSTSSPDLMMVASNEVEMSVPGPDGPRRRHPPDSCDAASVGGRHHRPHQGQPAVAHLVPRVVEDRPRTILTANGAETAARQGRHAVLPPASSRFTRVHRTAHLEQESARLASFPKTRKADLRREHHRRGEDNGRRHRDGKGRPACDEAARIVVQSGQASISYLQRRLRIGFNRAARLVDMMEMEGLVSPAAGGKPREVLVDKA